MQLHDDIETLQKGMDRAIALMNLPKMEGTGKKAVDAYVKAQEEHDKAGEAFLREEGPKLAQAGFRILSQFFLDINSIANGVNK